MILTVKLKENIPKEKQLFPRDIRNYLASITKPIDNELFETIMHHERTSPTFIFRKPSKKEFAVITYKNDLKTVKLMNHLEKIILENATLSFKEQDLEAQVEETKKLHCTVSDYKDGFFKYKIATPIVIGSGKRDYARARELSKDKNNTDLRALKKLTEDTITEQLHSNHNDWYKTEEIPELNDLSIILKDIKYQPIKYKDNQYYPAIIGTIISNKRLPSFVGYKIGLGYGQIIHKKD